MEKESKIKEVFEIGESITCVNTKLLSETGIKPPLVEMGMYKIKDIILDSAGNQHLDVGLKSQYNFVSSLETGEHLPRSSKEEHGEDAVHWCHPSRFVKNVVQSLLDKQK